MRQRVQREFTEIFEAVPGNSAPGDMRAEWKHPRIARLCRDLKQEMDRLPRRRRAAIITDHLAWFRVPVRKTK